MTIFLSVWGARFSLRIKNGELRIVRDYMAFNKITIRDSNPLPFINEAVDQVARASVFSRIVLLGAYHQVMIKEEYCLKTAIRTRFGSYEWRALFFGLTNAPAAFTRLISSLFHGLNRILSGLQ